jgi:hypothetical protein
MAEVPTKSLKLEETRFLSPPVVREPLYQCATAIVVDDFEQLATLDIERNGSVVLAGDPAGFPQPQGALIPIAPPLVAGDVIRARQKAGAMTSPWSAAVTVRDHTQDFPDGPRARRSILRPFTNAARAPASTICSRAAMCGSPPTVCRSARSPAQRRTRASM